MSTVEFSAAERAAGRGLGGDLARLDGPAKVTGAARYASDRTGENLLCAVLVGATVPSGRVVGLDKQPALAVEGVVAVIGPGELPPPGPGFADLTVPPLATRHLPLRDDAIVYYGQPVAAVIAQTLEAAEEGATRLGVSVAAAKFVVPDTAPDMSAEGGYAGLGALDLQVGAPVEPRPGTHHVSATYVQPARHNNPMEPSAAVAEWDGDRLTLYDAAQHVYAVRSVMAAVFDIDEEMVRIVSPYTGGGFGAKAFIWPHEILAAMLARHLGRPVKLTLTRAQMYDTVGYQPLMRHDVTLTAGGDGRLVEIGHDVVNTTAVTDDYVEFGSATASALYASPHIHTSQRVRRGNVNLPTFMRSPIDGPGTWALGVAMDELARAAGLDPLELRLRNYAEREPSSGRPWSSKKLREAYEEGARRFGWHERAPGGTTDGRWRIGCGMADATQGQFRFPSQATVSITPEGRVSLSVGFTDIGQGPGTIFPQVVAGVLGLDPAEVELSWGDSALPFAGPTYGSGTTIGVGAAALDAATELRDQLAELAGWPAAQVHCDNGELRYGDHHVKLTELVADLPGPLAAEGAFRLPGDAWADAGPAEYATRTFGAVFAEVGVDPELGLVRLRRATGVYSAGHIVNPRTARSQMIGGLVWGWGMATLEASHFEPTLGRWHSPNLAGVALPVNADIPSAIDIAFVDEFDEHAGPLGAKGIGELSATGFAAAVTNAVYDAVGVRITTLPIRPADIINALHGLAR
ncbi:MAG: xanthine dehydrogenase YagR molybdenum-binding subunit [Pseudonocardiales bacterium]|nr:xanthine dehydrogenase YagR molybdenum-binding subunit [Pseudonocardiales bacterium]